MGMDIHLFIVKDKEYLGKEIFDGRNSEWFHNMMQKGWNEVYDHLPVKYEVSEQAPNEIDEQKLAEDLYFGFRTVNVGDYRNWFIKYKPNKDAGWVSTYDKWRIENQGYIIEDIPHYLSSDDNINDMHFIEVENHYDCSKWLFEYLEEHNIPNDADITYWFDH